MFPRAGTPTLESRSPLAHSTHRQRASAYVRCMVMKAQVMVDNRVVDMVCLEKVLQRSGSFLGGRFDIVDLNRRQLDSRIMRAIGAEKREFEGR